MSESVWRRGRQVLALTAGVIALVGAPQALADPIQLVSAVETGLVFVEADCASGVYSGSGFLLGPRVMITARHVVVDGDGTSCLVKVTQQGSGAQATAVRWSLWYSQRRADAKTTDLAVVLLDRPLNGYYFRLRPQPVSTGDRVIALGYPYAEGLSITQGSIDAISDSGGVPIMAMRLLSDHGGSGGPILDLDGRVVGLVQRGGAETIYSLDLPAFTGGRPSSLCAGVVASVPSTLCGRRVVPVAAPSSNVYAGRAFSIRYPLGWRVRDGEQDKGSYVDTTIVDPSYPAWLLRIDTGLRRSASPEAAAAPVIAALRRERGYREISLTRVEFFGEDALRWEFTVREDGVLLHKVDIFFEAGGNDWAILFQAPAAQWDEAGPKFGASVASLAVH